VIIIKEGHWYHSAATGVFLHWGAPNGTPVEEFEKSTEGWDAREWVAAAKKLRASYVTLAAFHSDLNYTVPWKSKIPGLTNKTKRDFLGELLTEAGRAGIKVVVYITSSPNGTRGDGAAGCIDNDAYRRYKGEPSLRTETSFLDFQGVLAKEVVLELMENYPGVAGFWFDGWNDSAVCAEVFQAVHDKNPDCVNIRNNFYQSPYPHEDVMSQECLGKAYRVPYDAASASWLSGDAASEWCYVPFGEWYASGAKPIVPCAVQEQIKLLTSIITGGWVPKVGLPPYANGKFAPFVYDYLNAADAFLSWAGDALFGGVPGGLIGGRWNDGAYGFTARREEAGICYVFVADAPRHGGSLTLINNGFSVERVRDVRTGEEVPFSLDGGTLRIHAADWSGVAECGVMIFAVSAKRREVCGATEVNPDAALPYSVIIEAEQKGGYAGIELTETDTSPAALGGWGAPPPQRPREYALYNAETGVKLLEGVFENQRGRKWIPLRGVTAKKFRLELRTGYDTRPTASAACWAGGWAQYIDDCISVSSNAAHVVQFADSANALWEENCGNRVKRADGIKKVVCGNDGKFYYIDTEDNIVGAQPRMKAAEVAVSSAGEMFCVTTDGRLTRAGSEEVLADEVSGIAFDTEDTLYIAAGGKAYRYKDGRLTPYAMPYRAMKIAPGKAHGYTAIATPTGKVHLINEAGDNSFIAGYHCCDLNCGANGVLWRVIAPDAGRANITCARLFR
jgi:hypothetical protein